MVCKGKVGSAFLNQLLLSKHIQRDLQRFCYEVSASKERIYKQPWTPADHLLEQIHR